MKLQLLTLTACLSLACAQPAGDFGVYIGGIVGNAPGAATTAPAPTNPLDTTTNNNSEQSVIDCTWPCPTRSDGCIVTNDGARCGPRGADRWVIVEPHKAPVYTGRYTTRPNNACQPAPMPNLPKASGNSAGAGQTVIQWPMRPERRPLDEYLGNCRGGLYCSSAGADKFNPTCRIRFRPGNACQSPNQCYSGRCLNNVCQPGDDEEEVGGRD